ncbi:class F sortase [Nocardioides caeni]|uniref:Class F sortase n=1 Tax=Nocardioides caeni TaxID=574700 RepID=A0A4S8NGH2_9ACTN|nr:class F sortase [Nocardioides caeni]THV15900.1 class F sortase [Nocardioides caeni]
MDRYGRRSVALAAGLALVLLAVLLWWLSSCEDEAPPATSPPVVTTPTPRPEPAPKPVDPCARQARRGFVPTAMTVQGVVRTAEVSGIPRDGNGVVGVPPAADKDVFAWDLGGVEPGSETGHVLLNTHTWPDGSAMGNRLLAGLDVGDRLVLRGERGATACYRVTERVEVVASNPPDGWSAKDGAPQVVIVVCSGERRGPGDWSHRTLWFADPIGPGANPRATS